MTPMARSAGVNAPTLPAESGSLRPFFFASILTHTALIALAPFLMATSSPVPLAAPDDGGDGDWNPIPETQEPAAPEPPPAVDVPEPTPAPIEPEHVDSIPENTPPPVITPPVTTARVAPTIPRKPTATRSSVSGRPGPATASARPGPLGSGSGIQSPKPVYPYAARKMRLTGTGRVTAWTDPTGRVMRCEVSGLPGMLTEYTRQFVQENWRGPAGAQFSREIEYRLE